MCFEYVSLSTRRYADFFAHTFRVVPSSLFVLAIVSGGTRKRVSERRQAGTCLDGPRRSGAAEATGSRPPCPPCVPRHERSAANEAHAPERPTSGLQLRGQAKPGSPRGPHHRLLDSRCPAGDALVFTRNEDAATTPGEPPGVRAGPRGFPTQRTFMHTARSDDTSAVLPPLHHVLPDLAVCARAPCASWGQQLASAWCLVAVTPLTAGLRLPRGRCLHPESGRHSRCGLRARAFMHR